VDLLLVRHALPHRIEPGAQPGRPADPPLTGQGLAQAERLARWLAQERVDAVLSSPQRRAVETAVPVAAAHGLAVEVVAGLQEYDASTEHYVPLEDLKAAGDDEWKAMVEGRWTEYGGDDPHEFRARVCATVDEIVARFAGRRVVAVCHGGVINVAIADVVGIDRLLWFEPGYTSLHRVAASRSGVRSVVSVNEVAHLEATRDPTREAP